MIIVEYGFQAKGVKGIPSKISDREGSSDNPKAYKFIEWDFDFNKEIYKNEVIKPIFESVRKWYTVTFLNYDNSVHDKVLTEYGLKANLPANNPIRPSDSTRTYTFMGWEGDDLTFIDDDIFVKAIFDEDVRKYEVRFLDGNGGIFDTVYVEYRDDAELPEGEPRKDPTDNFAFKFIGWENTWRNIQDDIFVAPRFIEVDKYYRVEFQDENGNIINSDKYNERVIYRGSAIAPEPPLKAPSDNIEYVFREWDYDITDIRENVIVKPLYDEVPRMITVNFMNGDGTVLFKTEVLYGETVEIPEVVPHKLPNGDIIYIFAYWIDINKPIIDNNTEIYPHFTEIPRYYSVFFLDGDGNIFEEVKNIEYGKDATLPNGIPTKTPSVSEQFKFIGWDESYKNIEGETEVKAIFEAEIREFTVTFYDGNNNEFNTQTVKYGENAIRPNGVPLKEPIRTTGNETAYKFVGWSADFTNVRSDLSIYAEFMEVDLYYI